MTRGPTRKPAAPIGTADLAKTLGWSTERTRRTLLKLHRMKPGRWLITTHDEMDRLRYLVNVSLLRADWPAFFEAPAVDGDAEDRVQRLEERVAVLERRSRAHGAALRTITEILKDA